MIETAGAGGIGRAPAHGRFSGRRWLGRLCPLVLLGLVSMPVPAGADAPPRCAETPYAERLCPCADRICQKLKPAALADNWFRHGWEALDKGDASMAACAFERALQEAREDGREDGHTFKKLRWSEEEDTVPALPRDCVPASALIDSQLRFYPALYLAKACFDLAVESEGEKKIELCKQALESLATEPRDEGKAKIRGKLKEREGLPKALRASQCCGIAEFARHAQCPPETGGAR